MAAGMKGERRVVTVLFCDVKGSTTIAERLDPEEWAEIMNEVFGHLIGPIERYEGIVARLMGDAILAFFGAPVAHEDDPERAVLAALEILEAAAPYREKLQAERGIGDFDVRVGINTGLAVLGDVGKGVAVEYTALGDAVNVAARVQAAAEPGQILVTDATARRVGGSFDLQPLGSFEVKGRSAPVQMLRVIGRRTGPATQPGSRGPFVGREGEMAALQDAAAAVREGEGRIVTLVGEAGLGKSRLIEELRRVTPDLGWFESRAQSYGGSRSFLLFREHLLAWCGAAEAEPPDAIREKLRAAVADVAPAEAAAAAPIVELVTGVAGGEGRAPVGEELRKEIVRVVTLLARRQAASAPAVIVFDDVQWSDSASADLIGELLQITDEVPALLLISFRPDRRSVAWRVRQRVETEFPHRHTEVVLSPLTPPDAEKLLDELLGDRAISPRVRQAILAKAEGNPLFLEQFARAIQEEGLAADVTLPETLVSLLASRIDRLDERPRRVLQAASVIGRTFSHRLLGSVAEANGSLDRDLVDLQRADLIKEDQRIPDRVYSFRHALLQEVAYESLLQRRRRELHVAVAGALERTVGDRPDEFAALIGRHYAEAGDVRAIPHLRTAAQRALRLHALEDAIDLCDRALAIGRRIPDTSAELRDVYRDRGRALELKTDFDGALATYEEMEKLGQERGDRAMELRALSHQIAIYATPTKRGDLAKARVLVDRAIPAAREVGDRALLAQILWSATHAYAWSREEERAEEAGLEALVIARALGLKELEAYVSLDLARYRRFRKGWAESADLVRTAADLFREVGNKPMLADALSTLATGLVATGDYDNAIETSASALRLAEEIDNGWNRAFSRFSSPLVHFDRGDWGKAIAEWEDALASGREAGFVAVQLGPAADLAWIHHCAGNDERAFTLIENGLAAGASRPQTEQWQEWIEGVHARILVARGELDAAAAILERVRGAKHLSVLPTGTVVVPVADAELALARGDPERATSAIATAIAALHSFGYVATLDEVHYIDAEAHLRAGKLDAVRASLRRARDVSERLGSVRSRWAILLTEAVLAEGDGDTSAASLLREEAARIVRGIADSLRPVGLSESFLARPDVRDLLGK